MKSVRPLLAAVTAIAMAAALLSGTTAAVAADAASTDPSTVHAYRATPGDTASDRFALTANTKDIFVTKYANRSNNRMHVARFASDDTTPTLTITNNSAITSVKIYPEKMYPAGSYTISGSQVTFDMSADLRYAIVQINGSDPGLAIINDRAIPAGEVPNPDAANVVDASDYVTDLTGATDQTTQVNSAIDALYADSTKNTLYFPDGFYTYAGLELRNRTKPVTIYVDEGALLKNRIQPTMESMEPGIGIWDSSNITISGRGVFDANGFANYDTSNGGWRHDAPTSHHQGGVMVTRSSNIVFNDTLLRDAKQWNWETHTAKNVVFNNIKGLTPFAQPWIDGLDLASGQNLTVNGALTLGNDDTFASGHYNPDDLFVSDSNPDRLNWDTEDSFGYSINNHLGWSAGAGNGIRLGHSAYGHQMKDYTFNNVHYLGFSGGDNGITVQNQPDSGVRNYPRYESVVVKNSSFDTSKVNYNFRILGKNSADALDRIGQVTLDNVWFSNSLAGSVENATNLSMSNMTVAGQRVTRLSQTKWTLSNVVNASLDFRQDSNPVIPAIADQTVDIGKKLTLSLNATDADGDVISYSAGTSGLPTGSELNATTGVFTWTPVAGQDGIKNVDFVASNPNGASATRTVKITVNDPTKTKIVAAVTTDTNVQTWGTEQSANFGDNEHLRMLNFNQTARGPLGELYTGNQSSQDAKLTLLGFDLSPYAADLAKGKLNRAELSLTYMGATKGSLTGTNVLQAARVTGAWTEGNGKTTPTVRTNTVTGGVTWLTKPTIDTSTVASSAPFTVTTSAKSGNDLTYSNTQAIIGGTVSIDVTKLASTALASGTSLSLAVNESNKQDIIFVSREGAARNANAAGFAPTLTLYLDNPVTAVAPGAPNSVAATTVGADVKVSWAAPDADGGSAVTGYRVYDNTGAKVAEVGADVREATITGLAPATTRVFSVAAVNAVGEGSQAASSSVTTPAVAPGAPQSVAAAATGANVKVTWAAPDADGGSAITGYRVYDNTGAKVAEVAADAREAVITGLAPATTRVFSVAAVNTVGEGSRAAASSVTTASITLASSVQARCLAGKVYLYTSVTNRDETAATIVVRTAYGDKTYADVAPGKTVSAALPSRLTSTPAGQMTVDASQPDGVTAKDQVAYPALSCR